MYESCSNDSQMKIFSLGLISLWHEYNIVTWCLDYSNILQAVQDVSAFNSFGVHSSTTPATPCESQSSTGNDGI